MEEWFNSSSMKGARLDSSTGGRKMILPLWASVALAAAAAAAEGS